MSEFARRILAGDLPMLAVLALAGLVSTGCASSGVQPLAGCYDLTVGSWSPPVGPGDSLYVAPPPRIELDTIRVNPEEGDERFVLRTAPGALPSIHDRAWWEPVGSDSVRLVWFSMSGIVVDLERSGGTLSGTARARWDYKEVSEEARVRAEPVACDAPLAEHARLRYRYPRGVALATGDSLRLGDPVPEDWSVSDRHASRRVGTPALLPPFSDADEVLLYASPERGIHQIRIRFPRSYDHADVRELLSRSLGTPTSDSEHRAQDGPNAGRTMRLTSWRGRMVGIWFMTWTDGEVVEVIIAGR